MAGNTRGGKKTARMILKRNPNHYKEIGAIGGRLSRTGGFFGKSEFASIAGKKGVEARREKRRLKQAGMI